MASSTTRNWIIGTSRSVIEATSVKPMPGILEHGLDQGDTAGQVEQVQTDHLDGCAQASSAGRGRTATATCWRPSAWRPRRSRTEGLDQRGSETFGTRMASRRSPTRAPEGRVCSVRPRCVHPPARMLTAGNQANTVTAKIITTNTATTNSGRELATKCHHGQGVVDPRVAARGRPHPEQHAEDRRDDRSGHDQHNRIGQAWRDDVPHPLDPESTTCRSRRAARLWPNSDSRTTGD